MVNSHLLLGCHSWTAAALSLIIAGHPSVQAAVVLSCEFWECVLIIESWKTSISNLAVMGRDTSQEPSLLKV